MSAFYDEMLATANELITEFGQPGILRRPTFTGPSYNPTQDAPVDHPITVVVVDFTFAERNDSRVKVTDKKILLAVGSLAIEPAVTDTVVIGGVEHSIPAQGDGLGVKPLAPGATTVLWEVHCRA